MAIKIQLVTGGEPDGYEWTDYEIDEVEIEDVSGRILDVKKAIKKKRGLHKTPEIFEIFYNNKCLSNEDDAVIITKGGTTVALLVKEAQPDEAIDTKFKGGTVNKWIVTGNSKSFKMYQVKAREDVTIPIKRNSIFNRARKFAVISDKPEDRKWRGIRYELKEEYGRDIEIELRDEGTVRVNDEDIVRVITSESGDKEYNPLVPVGDPVVKTYDEDEMAARQKTIENNLTRSLTVIVIGVGILGLCL